MATTCKINESQPTDNIEYPCYKITDDGLLVLFYSYGVGTVIRPSLKNLHIAGERSEQWVMDNFKPLKGTFTAGNV